MRNNDEIKEFIKNKQGTTKDKAYEQINKILATSKKVMPDISQFERDNIRLNILAKIETISIKRHRFSHLIKWVLSGATLAIIVFVSVFYVKIKSPKIDSYYSYIINSSIDEYFYTEIDESTEGISNEDLTKYIEDNPDIINYYDKTL